jgi:hypothetical protein
MEPGYAVEVGGGGTRYDCLGGESPSDRSTFTYVSRASPRELSGSHASRREAAVLDFEVVEEEEETGRESGAGFCWRRAIYPGMLSFAEGLG